jgi:hypothetical protein
MRNLAALDGRSAFAGPLHIRRPNIGDRELLGRALDDILDSRYAKELRSRFEAALPRGG